MRNWIKDLIKETLLEVLANNRTIRVSCAREPTEFDDYHRDSIWEVQDGKKFVCIRRRSEWIELKDGKS